MVVYSQTAKQVLIDILYGLFNLGKTQTYP